MLYKNCLINWVSLPVPQFQNLALFFFLGGGGRGGGGGGGGAGGGSALFKVPRSLPNKCG